jgi:hypothetical protein
MGSRAEKILLDFLEEVADELKSLGQKKRAVRQHGIILDDRLMQNTIVIGMDSGSGFSDIYCKRGEVGVFYYGFYKYNVKPSVYNRFLRMFEVFRTWNYKKNYLDLYGLFNKLAILSFVEFWEHSLLDGNDDERILPLKIGDNHLLFSCYDSATVDLYIDKNNDVVFKRMNQHEKKLPDLGLNVKEKIEQSLVLSPGSEEYQIMIEVITKILDERAYFEKGQENDFYLRAREHMFNLMDFPSISSFQETAKKTQAKVHFL